MSWYGKIIGGSLGAIFGPAGAVAGASFGHLFDNKGNKVTPEEQPEAIPMSREERNAILFQNTFGMLAKMANADGSVTQDEVDTIKRFMIEHLNLNADSRKQAVKIFNEAKNNSDISFDTLCVQFSSAFRHDLKTRATVFEMLLGVALADKLLHPAEDRLLLFALKKMRLNQQAYEHIRRECLPDLDSFYRILGCSADCTDADLKQAFRKASKELHPDKLASVNVSEKVRALTEEKFKEVNEAYRILCKYRNIH
jgi:DnaJ like chaperone protein